jgi:organic hydroperoxide reductase OsmC/OhrA
MSPRYTARATASGGRDGAASSSDGKLDVRLSTPKELGGGGGEGINPEQLFAAGYAACFLGALKFVAFQSKIALPADARVDTTVGIGKREMAGASVWWSSSRPTCLDCPASRRTNSCAAPMGYAPTRTPFAATFR